LHAIMTQNFQRKRGQVCTTSGFEKPVVQFQPLTTRKSPKIVVFPSE
jgi:hypothetical protein